MKKQNVAIILAIVCFILVISIFIQMKTVDEMKNSVGTTLYANSELIDEVFSWQERYNSLYSKLQKEEKTLEKVRKEVLKDNQEDVAAEAELKENNLLLGLSEIKGEGIIITLDDNRDENTEELSVSKYLVHEEDLLQVVNELFNAGAEAVSINDHRIVGTTSILCDGNIIRVNGEIVTVPIEIKAICSKYIRNTLIRPDGYLQLMADDKIDVRISNSENITIPKYEGIYSYSYLSRGDE